MIPAEQTETVSGAQQDSANTPLLQQGGGALTPNRQVGAASHVQKNIPDYKSSVLLQSCSDLKL